MIRGSVVVTGIAEYQLSEDEKLLLNEMIQHGDVESIDNVDITSNLFDMFFGNNYLMLPSRDLRTLIDVVARNTIHNVVDGVNESINHLYIDNKFNINVRELTYGYSIEFDGQVDNYEVFEKWILRILRCFKCRDLVATVTTSSNIRYFYAITDESCYNTFAIKVPLKNSVILNHLTEHGKNEYLREQLVDYFVPEYDVNIIKMEISNEN